MRNEKVGGGAFTWSPDYILPTMGIFECDFIYLMPNRPTPDQATSEEEIVALLGWFQEKYAYFKSECGDAVSKIQFNGSGLADAFTAISDFIVISTKQLLLFLDLIEGKFHLSVLTWSLTTSPPF